MRLTLLFTVTLLALSSCFVRYVHVDSHRPLIPLDAIDRPNPQALVSEVDSLSPAAQADLETVVDYAGALRRAIEAYNAITTEHNQRVDDSLSR